MTTNLRQETWQESWRSHQAIRSQCPTCL